MVISRSAPAVLSGVESQEVFGFRQQFSEAFGLDHCFPAESLLQLDVGIYMAVMWKSVFQTFAVVFAPCGIF